MLTLGDIRWTTRLFHTANIDELMAEPPVAGAARQPAAEAPRAGGAAEAVHDPADRPDVVERRLAA
jgi:hypothetical protein